ncbi:cTAGE family member 5 isoform X2 [Austrofundulus limnaeus]|uniref:CTAGE family member 5 isoform X2 n=1 Tax=Austrofundulus limnaeus TaxID=52670 RepID=A0A2I4BNA7_AUSLI|nr:PREDICTED: cTAGE family member 5 isoform X2 [Austrofundulus limnaeus]
MDFSLGYKLVCMVGAVFVIFPCLNVGLLSDYKICGDSECESLMSRVQAVKDHHGKDCRFLSFRRGDTIFVYHKLTGKREDLWAGSIDKQFGYFPKDAVKEEQVYATTEIVVETQKSDFFCMDESGYPIDTTDLDADDDENLQTQESETIQMNPNAHDTNAAGSSMSSDVFTEVKAQEAEEEIKNLSDAAEPHEEENEAPATEKEQGGSPSSSSSWLGSSVTGWLGSSGGLDELAGEDEGKDTGADSSLTSSVTGWLGFGRDGKPDDVEENVKLEEESYTSTVTGWLGLGEKKAVHAEDEQNGEQETEPVEKFWSRRMSLHLEGDKPSCATCSTQGEEQKDNLRDEQMTAVKDQTGSGAAEEASLPYTQPGSQKKGIMKQTLDVCLGMIENSKDVLIWFTVKVVSSLPEDIRLGPDLYGVPWEPVLVTGLVGLVTFLLFTCRCYKSIKSRMYRSKEQWMAQQITQLLDEKCKVLETLSQCQQEYDELENTLRDGGVLAQTQKTEQLEVQARQLTDAKKELGRDLDQLKAQLEQQREQRKEQERRISELEESINTSEQETKNLLSQEEQAQTTVKIYDMNSDRLQGNVETAREENTLLQESNAQLKQQVEGWAERVSELEAEMQRCEVAHSAMLQDVTLKDERIMSLTDRLLRMKGWDSELEEVGGEEAGEKETNLGTPQKEAGSGRGDLTDAHLQKVQKLIYAAKLNADLKSVDEDKDRAFAKLNDEIKAKEDLQVSIQELENEKLSLQSDSKHYSDEVERLQQKLQIMTEMYQENELKLHRMLTVEEKERLQKEEKLNKADKNIAMALEELNNYRKRANEMEEELEKTKQSYQTQISAHETKAHNNWLAARAAERDLGDIRRENSLLRQKITDTQFKLDSLDKDPYALNSLARPLPFRAERSPYGSSPYGRPSSETRPFLSPPTLMDGPPARLSPRVSRGPVDPPGGQGELERSGGPHSDSGSNSPTWERDRRGPPPGPPGPLGPPGPPGYMFPEPGAPMFRRPPPPPAALGLLPPPGPFPPRGLPPGPPHPADMADGSFRENHLGPGDQDPRLADQRTPPELDLRMGGPPPRPPLVPMDGPFPRRAPYGPPPPPDFYPPRGPGALPMMPMWPPPQRMMLPPRLPPGGPPLPPAPHPNMSFYGPPMVHPPPDGPPPPQQPLPSPPHSQSPEENRPSPEDVI